MKGKPPGTIITFYSYKGGTGRSMALANVAWILASNGKKVLVIDWDLEAPGLHRYFQPFLIDPELESSQGLIDFVWTLAMTTMTPFGKSTKAPPVWVAEAADITPLAIRLDWDFGTKGSLAIIPAGQQGPTYSQRVNDFNWESFYRRLGGGRLIEAVRKRVRQDYDYVLIDSRTGVSDTSGICTVQMPDRLVACTTLNNQSLIGISAVLESIVAQRKDNKLKTFPVIMRIELSEQRKLESARMTARQMLAPCLPYLTESERTDYWNDAEILYYPYYAYEEVLATFGDRAGAQASDKSLLRSMEKLAQRITGNSKLAMPEVAKDTRQYVLDKYAYGETIKFKGRPPAPAPTSRADQRFDSRYTYDIYISYRRYGEWNRWVENIFLPIFMLYVSEELGREAAIFVDYTIDSGTSWRSELALALGGSRVLVPLWTPSYFRSEWCLAELGHMLHRERLCGYRTKGIPAGLIYPAILHGGEAYPPEARAMEALMLNEFANVRMAADSPRAEELAERIRVWVPSVAAAVDNAPRWDPSWSQLDISVAIEAPSSTKNSIPKF